MRDKVLFDRNQTFFFQEKEKGEVYLYKVFKNESPSPQQVANFFNEFEVLKDLQAKGIRKVLRKERVQGNYAIALEYVKGEPLTEFFFGQGLTLGEVLDISIQAARILDSVHSNHLVHHDIKPSNFIYDPVTCKLTLIDFGLAAPFAITAPYLATHEKLKGSLAYISPEQTGRMNRTVDYRSDLYSLGGTIYYLLTGHPPFLGDDPLALLHAQIAKQPESPHKLNPAIPPMLGKIVLRLLAKNAENRYQSAHNLAKDLEFCLRQYNLTGDIPEFELKDSQFVYELKVPEKLYGRADEIRTLERVLAEVKAGGRSLVLLEGLAGTGKSSLVREMERPITLSQGYFIRGKFDQLQRNIPYYGILQAFGEFCDHLNTESPQAVLIWKQLILKDLEDLGQILIDMIPNLEPILGNQPTPPALEGQEAANRLKYVFSTFVRNIALPEHPFVLFLDDMQWADNASIDLFQTLLRDNAIHHFLMIAAYRENEVSSHHPFALALEDLKQNLLPIITLPIQELQQEDLHQMLTETLRQDSDRVTELANILFQKTRGNPFFAKEFIKILCQKGAIHLDAEQGCWLIDIPKVRNMAVSASVVDFLIQWVKALPEASQRVMQNASCIGMRFSLYEISLISGGFSEELVELLEAAAKEGILIPKDHNYRLAKSLHEDSITKKAFFQFSHDRLLEAVYSMMPEEQKGRTHALLGRLMWKNLAPKELPQEIFNLTGQLEKGLAWITEPGERQQIATLFAKAGEKAKQTAAYQQAFASFERTVQLAEEAPQPDTALINYALGQAAETAYLIGQQETAQAYCEQLLRVATTPLEKMPALVVQLMMAASRNENQKALEIGCQGAAIMGEPFPSHPTLLHILWNLLKTKWLLRKIEVGQLSNLPAMQDPQKIWAMNFIEKMIPSAFRSGSNLFPLLVFRMLQVSLRYGNTPPSMFGYAAYGISLAGVMKDYQQAYRFGKMSQEVHKVPGGEAFSSHVTFVYNNFIRHWQEPLLSHVGDFFKAYQKGVETGYLFEAAWYAEHGVMWSLLYGQNIQSLENKLNEFKDIFRHNQPAREMEQLLRQCFVQLRSGGIHPQRLQGTFYDETQPWHHAPTEQGHYHMFRCMLSVVFGAWEEAQEHWQKFEDLKESHTAHPSLAPMEFFGGIILLQQYQKTGQSALLKRAQKAQKTLAQWSQFVPQSHLHRSLLLQAMIAVATHQDHQSHGFFDQAMQQVRNSGNHLEEGLVFEMAAQYYHQQNQLTFAKPLVQWAMSAYGQWGADAKVDFMSNQFSQVLIWQRGNLETTLTATSTETGSQGIDLLSVVKASQVISGEIHMNQLKDRLLQTVMENAGAQRACLILEHGGNFWVEGDQSLDSSKNPRFQPVLVLECGKLPQSVLQYVFRTGKDLVLAKAHQERRFEQDPYFQTVKVLSLLCLPIYHQGKLSGLLYLENNLLEGAFTQSHLEVLKMISSQIAVSIENAHLYSTMEEKIAERTEELNHALGEVQNKNHQIQSSIAYAKNIQASLLPSPRRMADCFAEYALIFEPRELVGGDIYLVERVAGGDFVILLDCTGHGVPGAFMTMIAGSAIKQILQSSQPRDPAWLLTEVNRVLKTSLQREEMNFTNDDGLEGGVCFVDRERKRLLFAGARFSLYHSREGQLETLKGDRQSLGYQKTPLETRFTTHEVALVPGQSFYMATDGYQDQTGGPKGFSIGEKRLFEWLGEIQHKPLDLQFAELRHRLNQWQGHHTRKDDLCLMGFRFL